MKLSLFAHTLSTVALILSSSATMTQPSYAQSNSSNKFFCGISGGRPATLVRTSRGNIPMISWVDGAFPPPWTPERRCEDISNRFQLFYDNESLKFIRAGRLRGQPVLCVAGQQGGPCLPNGVLVTLKPGTNPEITLRRLLDSRSLGDGRAVPLSGGDSKQVFSSINDAAYLDVQTFLNQVETPRINQSCPAGKPAWEC